MIKRWLDRFLDSREERLFKAIAIIDERLEKIQDSLKQQESAPIVEPIVKKTFKPLKIQRVPGREIRAELEKLTDPAYMMQQAEIARQKEVQPRS